MATPTPNWEDVNKLLEQNKQMRIWIEQQKKYIKALVRVIPSALMEDWSPNLPTLPNIPESFDLFEPRRMLKNPIDDSQAFSFSFPEKPKLPPREFSATANRMGIHNVPENVNADIYSDYFAFLAPLQVAGDKPSECADSTSKYFAKDKKYRQL